MDENQIIDNIHDENSNLYLTKEAREYLYKTSNWAMGFSILGFIWLGLAALGSVSMMAMGSLIPGGADTGMEAIFPIIGILYLVFVAIFAIPVWKHFKFAQKAKDSARREDSAALALAMKNLHGYYKWYGILMILGFVLYIVFIAVMMANLPNAANGFQF